METLVKTALLFFISMIAIPSFAQMGSKNISESGNRFVEVCSVVDKRDHLTETDVSDGALCAGFMMGIRSGAEFSFAFVKKATSNNLKGSMEDLGICLPPDVTNAQLVRVALKYMRENPEQTHLPTVELIVLAEFKAFPCENPASK